MRKYLAEFLGTFFLVFIGTGTVIFSGTTNVWAVGVGFGLSITVMAYALGNISGGHFNPAVSLAMLVNGRLALKDFCYYILCQFVGATLASAVLSFFVNQLDLPTNQFGQNGFGKLSAFGAFSAELIFSFLFIFVILMVTSKFGNSQFAPLAIGLTLALLVMMGLNLTGVSVNPARSFGPAIFAGGKAMSELWVFIVAPLCGGSLAAIFSKTLFSSEEK